MNNYPRSVAKYIRRQKALIRRRVLNHAEQQRLIDELNNRLKK